MNELSISQKAFIRAFMSNGGSDFNLDDVTQFVRDYDNSDSVYLAKRFGMDMYSAVVDAMNIWEAAVYCTKQSMLAVEAL